MRRSGMFQYQPPPEPEPETPRTDEDEAVARFTVEQLMHLGFNAYQAERLAELRVSWHDAEALVDAGCDPSTAFDILG